MRPIKLEMQGFGSYKNKAEVDFSRVKGGKYIIYGDTGAGKTLIFDAIMFALYGECSGEDRDSKVIRNSELEDSEETIVTLTFTHEGKVYILTRKFHFVGTDDSRKIKSSFQLTDAAGNVVGTKNADIQALIGLDKNQFRQIVMLAQGEFKRFLKSDAKEKSAILGKIVDSRKYVRYQELLKAASLKLSEDRRQSVGKIENIMSMAFQKPEESDEFPAEFWLPGNENLTDNLSALIESENAKFAETGVERDKKNNASKELNKKRGAAEEQNNLLDDLQKKSNHLADLMGQKASFDSLKNDLDLVAKASEQVLPASQTMEEKKDYLHKLNELIKQNKEDLAIFEKEKIEAEAHTAEDKQKKTETETLTKEIAKLNELLPKFEDLNGRNQDIIDRVIKIKKDQEALASKSKELENLKTKLDSNQKEKDSLTGIEGKTAAVKAELDVLKGKLDSLEKGDGIKNSVHAVFEQEGRLQTLEAEYKAILEEVLKLRADYDFKYDRFIRGQSGILASETRKKVEEEGEALCPVCGTHLVKGAEIHFAETEEDVPKQDEVEAAKSVWEKRDQEREAEQKKINTLKTGISAKKEELLRTTGAIFDDCADWEMLASDAYLSGKINVVRADIQAKETEIADLTKKQNRFTELQNLIDAGHKKETDLTGEIQSLNTAVESGNKELEQRKNEAEDLKKSLPYENEEAVRVEIQQKDQQKKSLEEIIEKHVKEAQDAQEKFNKQAGELKSNQEKLPDAETALTDAEAKLKQALTDTGFESVEKAKADTAAIFDKNASEFGTYTNPKDWIKAVGESCGSYDNDCKNTTERVNELKEKTKDMQRTDLSALDLQIKEAEGLLDAVNKQYNDLEAAIRNHNEVLLNVTKEKESLSKSEYAYKKLTLLSNVANVSKDGSPKIDFNRYVLGAIFKEVLERANDRLEDLLDDYRLTYKAEAGDARSSSGLDFEVSEKHLQKEKDSESYVEHLVPRDKYSLSGGESFVVALMLALGLSDYVQSRLGGIKIETLFIDEGFGTLDNELLSKTMNAIDKLSRDEEGRNKCLVGIISHIDKVEGGIDEKFHVIKGANGSTIKPEGMEVV